MRDLGAEDALALGVGVVDQGVAVRIDDLDDRRGLVVRASVGDSGVGVGHLKRRDRRRVGAQRQTALGDQVGLDAHAVRGLHDLLGTQRHRDAREAGVGRHRERAGDGARAVVGVAEVVDVPPGQLGGRGAVDVGRLGIDARLDGGDQRVGLEGRARRTPAATRAGGDVDLVARPILAADHRPDVAVVGIDGDRPDHERRIARRKLGGGGGLGGVLGLGIDRGDHRQTALEQLVGGVGVVVEQRVAHVAREVGVFVDAVGADVGDVELERRRHGGVVLLLRDVAVGQHAVEHQVAALQAVVGVVDGVVVGRRLGNAHEGGRLDQREVARVLREVALRRSLDAVGARAVVDGVEVHLEDLVFGVELLHLQGEIDLAHLALDGDLVHLRGQDGLAHELLRDGGGAFLAAGDVDDDGARDAGEVDAVVLVEALVLGVDRGEQHVLAHLGQLDGVAVLKLELREHRGLIAGEDRGGARLVVGVDLGGVGQVLQPRGAQGPDSDRAGDERRADDGEDREKDRGTALLLGAMPVFHRA